MPVGQQVTVATTVSDPGTDDVTCMVAWGDGTTSTGCSPSHGFTTAGGRTITVTADDGEGGTTVRSVSLTVPAPAGDPQPQVWPWQGFFAPVDNLPVVNVTK